MLKEFHPKKIIYSRNELKKLEMHAGGFTHVGKSLPDGFRYGSNTNTQWLDIGSFKKTIAPFEKAYMNGN